MVATELSKVLQKKYSPTIINKKNQGKNTFKNQHLKILNGFQLIFDEHTIFQVTGKFYDIRRGLQQLEVDRLHSALCHTTRSATTEYKLLSLKTKEYIPRGQSKKTLTASMKSVEEAMVLKIF